MHFYELTINERILQNGNTLEQRNFAKWILNIGDASKKIHTFEKTIHRDIIEIPEKYVSNENLTNFSLNVYSQFKNIIDKNNYKTSNNDFVKLAKFFKNRAILTTKNNDVSKINDILLEKYNLFGDNIKTYTGLNIVSPENAWNANHELLKNFNDGSLPQYKIRLKIGVPIMLLRNIDTSNKLCNGTRLIVRDLTNNLIFASIFDDIIENGENAPIYTIPRINMRTNNRKNWNISTRTNICTWSTLCGV